METFCAILVFIYSCFGTKIFYFFEEIHFLFGLRKMSIYTNFGTLKFATTEIDHFLSIQRQFIFDLKLFLHSLRGNVHYR